MIAGSTFTAEHEFHVMETPPRSKDKRLFCTVAPHREGSAQVAQLLANVLNEISRELVAMGPDQAALEIASYTSKDGGRMGPASMGEEQ